MSVFESSCYIDSIKAVKSINCIQKSIKKSPQGFMFTIFCLKMHSQKVSHVNSSALRQKVSVISVPYFCQPHPHDCLPHTQIHGMYSHVCISTAVVPLLQEKKCRSKE